MKTIIFSIFIMCIFTIQSHSQVYNPGTGTKIIPRNIDPAIVQQLKTIKQPYTKWKPLVDLGLRGAFFRFNNFDAAGLNRGDSFQFYREKDIRLRIPLMGIDSLFDYKPLRYNPFTVYFKDIKTNKIIVDAKNSKLNFYVSFESDDIEIATNCVDNIICGGTGNPNFHINNLSFSVEMEPFAENGKIRYRNAVGKVVANAGHDGFNFLITPLDPLALALNGPLMDLASTEITNFLNNPETINDFSQKIYEGIVAKRALFGFATETPYFTSFFIDTAGNLIYNIR